MIAAIGPEANCQGISIEGTVDEAILLLGCLLVLSKQQSLLGLSTIGRMCLASCRLTKSFTRGPLTLSCMTRSFLCNSV